MNEAQAYAGERAFIERTLDARVPSFEHVQTLWSGYGQIVRARLEDGRSMIIKSVHPPSRAQHPRGWSTNASHARKLRSYEVECAFYEKFESRARPKSRTARCYALERTDHGWFIALEDLDAAGYDGRRERATEPERMQCLKWLAGFHATFMAVQPEGLWPIGTYWHLGTRQEELAALDDRPLREAAPLLDAALSRCEHQTLVHGDAKIANFCFSKSAVAAVDFQYVGGGCGIKDVAYFLSSCLSDEQCARLAPAHLDAYFEELQLRLPPDINGRAVEDEWRALYPAAWADFHRFLAGWAPGHWKIHDYTRAMTERALLELR